MRDEDSLWLRKLESFKSHFEREDVKRARSMLEALRDEREYFRTRQVRGHDAIPVESATFRCDQNTRSISVATATSGAWADRA